MTREDFNLYIEAQKKYRSHYKKFWSECLRIIERFSEIEDILGMPMTGILYEGQEIYMTESKHWGEVRCDFRFSVFGEENVEVWNENFEHESYFDIKYLFMTEEEFMAETQKIIDKYKNTENLNKN